ncbi:discoidin domain-containing protein [Paenibacillus sp. FSL H3-0333]|uniref:discoidin domain-containing protein n=1 Tax=Paenibacillus sp. FSL H3-0333 TaxID=2921373 RepID=UPI0030FB514C
MATYYVNGSSGADTSNGSIGTPFLTLNKALSTIAQSGDVIILSPIVGLTYTVSDVTAFQTKSFTLQSDRNSYAIIDFGGLACNTAATTKKFTFLYFKNMGTWNSSTGAVSLIYENCIFEGIGSGAAFWTNSSSVIMTSVLIKNFKLLTADNASVNLIRGTTSSSFTNIAILNCTGVTAYSGSVVLSKSIMGSAVTLNLVSGNYVTTSTNEESKVVSGITYGLLVSSIVLTNKFLISSGDGEVKTLISNTVAIPIMTSNTTPSGRVTTNITPLDTTSPYQAFDGKTNTYFHTNVNVKTGWLAYEFPSKEIIQKYSLESQSGFSSRAPKNWTFEGSNDGGSTWTVLDTQINQTFANNIKNYYSINNETRYKIYRINITANNGDQYLTFCEMEMIGEYPPILSSLGVKTANEQDYIHYGMEKATIIDLNLPILTRQYVQASAVALGSGKVFKQKIDTSKVPIKVVSVK